MNLLLAFLLFSHLHKSTFKPTILMPGECTSIIERVNVSHKKRNLLYNFPGDTGKIMFAGTLDDKQGLVTFYECNATNNPMHIKEVPVIWEVK